MTSIPERTNHEVDQVLVHHFIRLHGRVPTPQELKDDPVSVPRPRRPAISALHTVRRTAARLVARL